MSDNFIKPIEVAHDRFKQWGVTVNDYQITVGGTTKNYDFESLVVEMTARRATTIESEVQPLAALVSKRNSYMKTIQTALGDLTKIQENFASDVSGGTYSTTPMLGTTATLLSSILAKNNITGSVSNPPTKALTAEYIQVLKAESEKLNNDSQTDTTRLQSLVSKRDDAFTSSSTIMGAVSETRGNVIKGMS